jgi:multimeric flavodoxin WrbA
MHVLAVNGSPRKNRNTAQLLNHALEGARSQGATTELIHLWDIDFRGCSSCFTCKRIGDKGYGICSMKDGLKPVLDKIREVDGLILGSPVYYFSVTGGMRSFMERLLFPYYVYDEVRSSLYPKKIETALVVSMNRTREDAQKFDFDKKFGEMAGFLKTVFGSSELLQVYNTYQFDDYSKYYAPSFPEEDKARQRREQFPEDCRLAFELGKRLVQKGSNKG